MFTSGQAVGSIQPYFISQIEQAIDPSQPIASGTSGAAILAQSALTAHVLADFVAAATATLDIAIYDFRLDTGVPHDLVVNAINAAAERGVAVRIAYDEDENTQEPGTIEDFIAMGADPAPDGTDAFMKSAQFHPKVQRKAITGHPTVEGINPQGQIMHNKYIVRDAATPAAAVLMGSANFTLDAWGAQENNVLVLTGVPDLAPHYESDFQDLWTAGKIAGTGAKGSGTATLPGNLQIQVTFAPGHGAQTEQLVAQTIAAAKQRVYIASMDISSGLILQALVNRMAAVAAFQGIYDGGSMLVVENDWAKASGSRENSAKSAAATGITTAEKQKLWAELKPHLVGKNSIPYKNLVPHNFMHNKVVVCDDVVVTGSFNFSNNATKNAENVLVIPSQELADQYVAYIKTLVARYGPASSGPATRS